MRVKRISESGMGRGAMAWRMGSQTHPSSRRGVVYIMALIGMILLVGFSFTLVRGSMRDYQKADNSVDILEARHCAESGVSYVTYVLRHTPVTDDDLSTVMDDVYASFGKTCAVVSKDGDVVTMGAMSLGGVGTVSATIAKVDDSTGRLTVTGQYNSVSRTISVDFHIVPGGKDLFNHGVILGGALDAGSNGDILSANGIDGEASVLSTALSIPMVFVLGPGTIIDGDLMSYNPDGLYSIKNGTEIYGVTGEDAEMHITFGLDPVSLPRPDTTFLEPFTTAVYSGDGKENDGVFTNLRIPSGTTVTFSNVEIRGVMYIEAGCNVTFQSCKINGVVATEDPGVGQTGDNTITIKQECEFMGLSGLDNVNDGVDYSELQAAAEGASLLAPGFFVEMQGCAEASFPKTLVAETFLMNGNPLLRVRGSIFALGEEKFTLLGTTCNIVIDRKGLEDFIPPGFVLPPVVEIKKKTYKEH